MTITKRGSIKCDRCGKFCAYFDEWIPFGCADPEDPEPYDPSHCCEKCWPEMKSRWIEDFKKRRYYAGDWQKSRAEREAADEAGLVWLHSSGIGTFGTDTNREPYQYIPKEDYEQLSKLPRFINNNALSGAEHQSI